MILKFEGFFKPPGYTAAEGNPDSVTVNSGIASSLVSFNNDSFRVYLKSVPTTSASIQLDAIPAQRKFAVGMVISAATPQLSVVELAGATPDLYDRSKGIAAAVALPDLPTLLCYNGSFTLVAPGAPMKDTPAEFILDSWLEPAVSLTTDTHVEIEYDFDINIVRVLVEGVIKSIVSYPFSPTQRNSEYKGTCVIHALTNSSSGGYSYLKCLYAATGAVGKCKALRLSLDSDVSSTGFADGVKFSAVTGKAGGFKSTVAGRAEFGLQNLPAGTVPLAVVVNGSVSSSHKSALWTEATFQLLANGTTLGAPRKLAAYNVAEHLHLNSLLVKHPSGQPWTEESVNALTVGLGFTTTTPLITGA